MFPRVTYSSQNINDFVLTAQSAFKPVKISERTKKKLSRFEKWIRFSVPLEKGKFKKLPELQLRSKKGKALPLQTRVLSHWPDGSVRWFDAQAISDRMGDFEIAKASRKAKALKVVKKAGEISVNNGPLSLTLSQKGTSPIKSISFNGKGASATDAFEARLLDMNQRVFSSKFESKREIKVVEHGPVSTVLEVYGKHLSTDGADKCMSYRLRIQVYAGIPVIVLRYRFFQDDPGKECHELPRFSVSTRWNNPSGSERYLYQVRHGDAARPRNHTTTQGVDIRVGDRPNSQAQVFNSECLGDDTDYPPFLRNIYQDTEPCLGQRIPGGWVVSHVQDMEDLYPKGLRSEADDITLDIGPDWCEPVEIPQGRSREITQRLVFLEEDVPTYLQIANLCKITLDEGNVTLEPDWYAQRGELMADSLLNRYPEGAYRFDHFLNKIASLPTVTGMWELGDTIDPGYTGTYSPIGRQENYGSTVPHRFESHGFNKRFLAPWANPGQFEPVYINNEYDVILCLAREWLRGGHEPFMWQKLGWFCRHAIEVDFVCFSDSRVQHHGSPAHSAKHNNASAYPSHLWCEGLVAYYLLSGDEDALDVITKVGDYILWHFNTPDLKKSGFNRELGWALIYLSHCGELTGEKRFLKLAKTLADFFIGYPLNQDTTRDMVRWSFGAASIVMGVEAWYKVSGQKKYADYIVKVADDIVEHTSKGVVGVEDCMTLNYLNPAYEITNDEKYVKGGMRIVERLLDSRKWSDPILFGKPVALIYRGLSRFFKHAHNIGVLQEFDYRY